MLLKHQVLAPIAFVLALVLAPVPRSAADVDCPDARVYSKDLTESELEFLIAFLPGFDQVPDAITVLNTAKGPIYQLVTTCDGGNDWVFEAGMSSSEYQTFFDENAAKGYRPHIVEVYGNHPNETYLSVMVNDGRSARGRHRILPSDWLKVRAELESLENGTLDPAGSRAPVPVTARGASGWSERTRSNRRTP